jgi:protein-L-isoaspartate(D-aspartate) O-methyltransferase
MSMFGSWGRRHRDLDYESLRREMVEHQIRRRGIPDERVLAAMREVPRHLFVPVARQSAAYGDHALPIGFGQTISQPFIVALMTTALRPEPGLRALEVGAGSGYQAAVLAACGLEVFTVERIPELYDMARFNLRETGYLDRVQVALGDGSRGFAHAAPFDRILVAAAAHRVPADLWDQLPVGGILVAPVGGTFMQTIYRYTKAEEGGIESEALEGARFVPLVTDE